jgi:hypothetical protein
MEIRPSTRESSEEARLQIKLAGGPELWIAERGIIRLIDGRLPFLPIRGWITLLEMEETYIVQLPLSIIFFHR